MPRLPATIIAAFLGATALVFSANALAAPQKSAPRTLPVSFRVHVAGKVPAGATFWLAYGPLDGQWGIVQLKSSGQSLYGVTRRVPTSNQGVFTFLEAQGIRHTRLGDVPGGTPVVLSRVGPISATRLQNRIIKCDMPRG